MEVYVCTRQSACQGSFLALSAGAHIGFKKGEKKPGSYETFTSWNLEADEIKVEEAYDAVVNGKL